MIGDCTSDLNVNSSLKLHICKDIHRMRGGLFRKANIHRLLTLTLACLLGILLFERFAPIISNHSFDLAYEEIFQKQFAVYLLTKDCGRYTIDVASTFESVYIVPDVHDSPRCAGMGELLLFNASATSTPDSRFGERYAQVLEHCHQGEKMKCLVLEDDVVFIHEPRRTRQVLVENTLTLFTNEDDVFDCSKRGFGWLRTEDNSNGSQCRIYSKDQSKCLNPCFKREARTGVEIFDFQLGECQVACEYNQHRFLLIQHTGLKSSHQRNWN